MLTLDKCAGIGIVERNKLNISNNQMQKETRQITVPAYRDKEGNPCCAINFNSGEVCPFYRTARFGTREICNFTDIELQSRSDGTNTLIPCEGCPVWTWAE